MIATNTASVKSMTISNCDFDGFTEYSASCDNRHYWTMLFYGTETQVSLVNNYIHQTSGRSPKVGGNTILHAANNYFYNNSGHNFDPTDESYTVAEGNYMDTCTEPVLLDDDATGALMVPTSDTQSYCESALGRDCIVSAVVNSGAELTGQSEEAAVTTAATVAKAYEPSAAETLSLSSSNFGVGDLDAVDGSSSSATKSTAASSTVASTALSGSASISIAATSTSSSAASTVSSDSTAQETSYALPSSYAQTIDASSETETSFSVAGEADDLAATANTTSSYVSMIAATDNSTASIASSQTSASSANSVTVDTTTSSATTASNTAASSGSDTASFDASSSISITTKCNARGL